MRPPLLARARDADPRPPLAGSRGRPSFALRSPPQPQPPARRSPALGGVQHLAALGGEAARWGTVPLIDMLKEAVLRTGCLTAATSVARQRTV